MAEKINVAELVEKMPQTDRELEAIAQAAKQTEGEKKPIPQNPESKFTGPDPDLAREICESLLKGAPDSIRELVTLIKDPASAEFKNYKAEYLTHIIAVYTGAQDRKEQRKMVARIFASYLGDGKTPEYVQGFLTRQLERIGDAEVTDSLGKLLTNENLCDYAAAAIISIKEGAIQQLKNALPKCTGRCKLVAIQSLALLGDTGSAKIFRDALKDKDVNIRLAGALGIVKLADTTAIPDLLKAADVEAPYERAKMASACIQLAENLSSKGKKQEAAKIFTYLRDSRKDPEEKYIRELAEKWLATTVL